MARTDMARMMGLAAEGGVLADDEVSNGEAGQREEGEGDAVEMDRGGRGSTAGCRRRCGAGSAVDADVGRDEREEDEGANRM